MCGHTYRCLPLPVCCTGPAVVVCCCSLTCSFQIRGELLRRLHQPERRQRDYHCGVHGRRQPSGYCGYWRLQLRECACKYLLALAAGGVCVARGPSPTEVSVSRVLAGQGVAFIHSRRQIHRDIKPGNLLINHVGDVKVSDFGIVKEMGTAQSMANTFVGTLTYMSPERISGEVGTPHLLTLG